MDFAANRVTWRGVTYDSQLEADWACTLASWGIEHKYHPGRVYLPEGELGVWEPDFQLEGLGSRDVLLEVKGGGNERIEKAWAARDAGYGVVVGRPGVILGGNEVEVAVAVWEGPWAAVRASSGRLVMAQEVLAVDGMFDEAYFSAPRAVELGRLGIRSFKAVGSDGIV